MAFYDVGTGDLRELWESYLPETVSAQPLWTDKRNEKRKRKKEGGNAENFLVKYDASLKFHFESIPSTRHHRSRIFIPPT